MRQIEIVAASTHNLREVSLRIPKNRLVAVTGVSGSGKSSLAYDTLFQEGQRRYLESLSVTARQFIKSVEKPAVRSIRGISPTIAIDQKHSSYFHNSTVGTISEVSPYLRLLYARVGEARCPRCGDAIHRLPSGDMAPRLRRRYGSELVRILAPLVRNRRGQYRELFDRLRRRGFLRVLVDGEWHDLDNPPELDRYRTHQIAVLVDSVEPEQTPAEELNTSIETALAEGDGEILLRRGEEEELLSRRLYCPRCDLALREPQPATFSLNSPLGACPECGGRGRGEKPTPCPQCGGSGYGPDALAFRFRGRDIHSLGEMEIRDIKDFFDDIPPEEAEAPLLAPLLPQIRGRLDAFLRLRLDYLGLNRRIQTLSGGELQRTRLVSQIGFRLAGIIYVLDEPTIGMHMSEVADLVEVLKELRDAGNSVVVVEHDPYTIAASDWLVDLGPGSGEDGGRVVYAGPTEAVGQAGASLTADHLLGRGEALPVREPPPEFGGFIRLTGVSVHNLQELNVHIPGNALTVVTGVSGSGKSSLVMDALVPMVRSALEKGKEPASGLKIPGEIRRIQVVDQSAIGRNVRSCPATYVGLMSPLRELFAATMEARMRGYAPGRFSFNKPGGRCEACAGMGVRRLEMGFLPRLEVTCPVCNGRRFNSETLKVHYRGRDIAEVLDMTIREAGEFFRPVPEMASRLRILSDVGLGYLRLGQPSSTLSGGESQRIKLSRELGRRTLVPTLTVLDEPTVGLHAEDVRSLIRLIYSLVARGGTVVVVEHNAQVIRAADWVVDLGPGGGRKGGLVVFQGPLKDLLRCRDSLTARWLNRGGGTAMPPMGGSSHAL